jgi:hypothetical protein
MQSPLRAMKLHAGTGGSRLIAREITLNLLDLVMEQDEKHQAALIAHIVGTLGGEYLETTRSLKADPAG